jgi:hypothetical protein
MRKFLMTLWIMAAIGVGTTSLLAQGMMQATPEQRAQRLKDTLALSTDQFARVLKIYQDMDQRRHHLFSSESGDRQARMGSMRSLMDSTDTRIDSVLSADQKVKYEAIKKARMERGRGGARRD